MVISVTKGQGMETATKPNVIEIRHKLTNAVLWSGEADSLKAGIERALEDGANLRWANLDGANLDGANLDVANLYGASLYGANLYGASLYGANLDESTLLDTGETWGEYLAQTLPALLTAGGKSLAYFAPHWACHEWNNCPMAFAFDIKSEAECPILLRPRVRQFVKLFDSKLIPWDAVRKLIEANK